VKKNQRLIANAVAAGRVSVRVIGTSRPKAARSTKVPK
jgi:hypothetical protein